MTRQVDCGAPCVLSKTCTSVPWWDNIVYERCVIITEFWVYMGIAILSVLQALLSAWPMYQCCVAKKNGEDYFSRA